MDDYYLINESAKADTTAILKEAYPEIEAKMKKNLNKYKQCVSKFISNRTEVLYANAPMQKMYFGESEIEDLYKMTQIDRKSVEKAISHTYYYSIADFNPRYAKDDFVVSMMCIIRYLRTHHYKKELELAMIHLACSGKFYTSAFHASFPITDPQPHIMEYVVTNMCSNKFDIVREGNVIGAIKSICYTWIDKYESRLKSFADEDITYLVQQLHNRVVSFIRNIATLYYEAFENRDLYITYDADNVSDDNYHLADSDSFKMQRATDATMAAITNKSIDYALCKTAADSTKGTVKVDELKSILEVLFSKPENMPLVREFVSNIIAVYFKESKTKDVRDLSFVTYTITPKPNTKDIVQLRQRELLLIILNNNSEKFARRRSRKATEQAYFKAMLMYFALLIQKTNKSVKAFIGN